MNQRDGRCGFGIDTRPSSGIACSERGDTPSVDKPGDSCVPHQAHGTANTTRQIKKRNGIPTPASGLYKNRFIMKTACIGTVFSTRILLSYDLRAKNDKGLFSMRTAPAWQGIYTLVCANPSRFSFSWCNNRLCIVKLGPLKPLRDWVRVLFSPGNSLLPGSPRCCSRHAKGTMFVVTKSTHTTQDIPFSRLYHCSSNWRCGFEYPVSGEVTSKSLHTCACAVKP